jgi:hypothetical protein
MTRAVRLADLNATNTASLRTDHTVAFSYESAVERVATQHGAAGSSEANGRVPRAATSNLMP